MKNILLQVYFLFRLPFLYLLKVLFPVSLKSSEEIFKILIVRIDRIGDFILTLPVVENLKLKYPQAQISVLVRPYLRDLVPFVKGIDKAVIYDKKIAAIRQIRKEKYDLAIDMLCDYRLDSAFLTFISAASRRAGFKGGYRELWFNDSVDPSENKNLDMVQLNLELLKLLGIPCSVTVPQLSVEKKAPASGITIAMHPGGYYATQRWAAEKFILLGRKILAEYQVTLLVVEGPGEAELVNRIVSGIGNENALPALTGIKDLVYLLSRCALCICNNSGPLHLANALGIPTVSMMGPTDPVLWEPKGEKNTVISKRLECSPCSKAKCKTRDCLELITVEEVFAAVKNRMEKIDGIKRSGKNPDY